MVEHFLRITSGLYVGVWVARYLGPEQFGLFSYVLAFTAIFGGIAKFGFDGIMVRELVNHPEKRDIYLGTAFWLKFIGSFVVLGLIAFILPLTSNDTTTDLFIFIISTGLIFQSFEVIEFYFQSQVLAKIVSICKIIQLTLSVFIKIALVLVEAELIWFVLVSTFDAVSLAISYFIAYQLRKKPVFCKSFDLRIAKLLFKNSWPLMIALVLSTTYTKIDQIMIANILGNSSLGSYSAALRIYDAFMAIIMVFTASLFPMIIASKKRDMVSYRKAILRILKVVICTSFLFLLFSLFFSNLIVVYTFGADFNDANEVLILMALNSIAASYGLIMIRVLITDGRQKKVMLRGFIGLLLNMSLNIYLIPLYGIEGAAYSTLISFFFAHFLLNVLDDNLAFIYKRS